MLFYVVLLGYVHWRDRRYKGGATAPQREEEEEDKQTRRELSACLAVRLAVMVTGLLICLSDQIAIILN